MTDVDTDAEHLGGRGRAGMAMTMTRARSLHLMVVAEGVDTEAEQAFLIAHGRDMAQGFLHARPIPAREFEAWLASTAGAVEAGKRETGGGAGRVPL